MKKHFPTRKAMTSRRCANPKRTTIPHAELSSPEQIALAFEDHVFSSKRQAALAENFVCWILDIHNNLLDVYSIEGTVDHAAVYPREIALAVMTAGGVSVVLSHNHPSGNILPSAQDVALTKRVDAALKTLDIRVHDHVIVAHDVSGKLTWMSMREAGLI